MKSSSLSNHLKHKDGKKRLENKEASERDIAKELAVYSRKTHIVGETIAESTQVFRVKVEQFCTLNLSEFITSWISLFSHSPWPKTKILWIEQTGKSMATYSAIRWWRRWEVIEQVPVQFGGVLPGANKE